MLGVERWALSAESSLSKAARLLNGSTPQHLNLFFGSQLSTSRRHSSWSPYCAPFLELSVQLQRRPGGCQWLL